MYASRRRDRPPPPEDFAASYGYAGGYAPQYGAQEQEPPLLFDDPNNPNPPMGYSSYNPGGFSYAPMQSGMPMGNVFQNPLIAGVASQYGQNLMGQGKEMVDQHLGKYSQKLQNLKYYFAVDTKYVVKKIGLLFFPFTHRDWALQFSKEEMVQPKHDINAPDLYIPTMAFVTYIFLAGLVFGLQNKFSPEQLGMHASSSLAWLCLEVGLILVTIYLTNLSTDLVTYDLVSYCSYKYVGMIAAAVAGILLGSLAYYLVLLYSSLSLAFLLVRALRVQILPRMAAPGHDPLSSGNKRRIYLLVCIAFSQPLLMWWRTSHLFSGITQ